MDGVPVTLELTYLLPTGTEITVVTERAIQLPTFQSDLPQLVWNVATTRAGVGTILMREHAAGRIAEFEALRRAEHQAQLDWLASGHQGTGVLRVDGRDVPAIRLDRPEVTAIGADLGQIRVAVAGPATALQACELTFDPHASRRSTQA